MNAVASSSASQPQINGTHTPATPGTAAGSNSNGFTFPEAVSSAAPSQNGQADVPSSSRGGLLMQQDPGTVHAMNVCASIWDTGFQKGRYSDLEVQVRDRSYHLHRLILSQSSYFARSMDLLAPHEPVRIQLTDSEITDEAIAICLGYLYAPFAVNLINPHNARSVLLASILLGLPDLSSLAYDLCRKSIEADSIRSWIEWCDSREEQDIVSARDSRTKQDGHSEKGDEGSQEVGFGGIANYINGSLASAMGLSAGARSGSVTPSEVSAKAGAAWVGGNEEVQQDDWVGRLRSDVKNYLSHGYAQELSRKTPASSGTPLTANAEFAATFTTLPFELFKSLLEDASFTALGTDQERFGFAKKIIVERRKKALATASAQKGMSAAQAKAQVPVENVVLRFGGGNGSNVHVTRKTQARTLWKVEKEA